MGGIPRFKPWGGRQKSGKCEPWRIDGAAVAKGAAFRLKSDWSAEHKARVLRERMG